MTDFRGPGFVDHHAHLLRYSAGAPSSWAVGKADAGGVAGYHRRLAAEGTSPMDDEPEPLRGGSELEDGLRHGLELAAGLGLVEVWEAGLSHPSIFEALSAWRDRAGRLPVRVRVLMASGVDDSQWPSRTGDPWLDVVGVKFYADGWLGPRTCAVCDCFLDRPGDHGILFQDRSQLARRMEPLAAQGWKLVTHAIGDRAIDETISAFEMVFGGDRPDPAPRIEHVQILRPDLIERMAAGGIEACIQPSFASSDVVEAAAALGASRPLAYRWSALLHAGVTVVCGSDYPIEDLSPLVGLRDLVRGPIDPLPADVAFGLMTDAKAGTTVLSADPAAVPNRDLGQIVVRGTEPSSEPNPRRGADPART